MKRRIRVSLFAEDKASRPVEIKTETGKYLNKLANIDVLEENNRVILCVRSQSP